MEWQFGVALVLVTAACGYLVWSIARAGRTGCGGKCACDREAKNAPGSDQTTLIPAEQLRLRQH